MGDKPSQAKEPKKEVKPKKVTKVKRTKVKPTTVIEFKVADESWSVDRVKNSGCPILVRLTCIR
jgi:hypothetical protein